MSQTISSPSAATLRRWALRLGVAFLALALGLTIAAWAALRLVDMEAITARVRAAVEEATGRALTIGGDPELTLLPQPRVVLRDIALANPPGASREQMLTARRINAGISLVSVLTGRGLGVRVEVTEPDVLLERDKKGVANWRLLVPARDLLRNLVEALGVVAQYARFEAVEIENARIGFRDGQSGVTRTLKSKTARASLSDEALNFEVTANVDGEMVRAEGSVGTAHDTHGTLPVTVNLVAPGASAMASGKVRPDWPSDGTEVEIDIKVGDEQRLAAATGVPVPDLPKLAATGRLSGRDGALRVEPLSIAAGASKIGGFVEFRQVRSRPYVSARLDAALLDLAELGLGKARPAPQASAPPSDGRLVPDIPLAIPELRKADGKVSLAVKRLVLPDGGALADVSVNLSLAGGRLTADPVTLGTGDSRISAKLALDASSPKSSTVDAAIRARGAELGALQGLLPAGVALTGGRTDAEINVSGRGDSLRLLLGSLNGHIHVVVGDAKISGTVAALGGSMFGELVRTLDPFAARDDSQHLKCAVVNVPLRNGVLTATDGIGIETDKLAGVISGQVDFGKETLDVNLRSEAVDSVGPGIADFAGAGQLTGTFAEPSLALNARGAAELGVSVGAAVATGGISLLAGSLLRAAIPAHPCAVALEGSKQRDTR